MSNCFSWDIMNIMITKAIPVEFSAWRCINAYTPWSEFLIMYLMCPKLPFYLFMNRGKSEQLFGQSDVFMNWSPLWPQLCMHPWNKDVHEENGKDRVEWKLNLSDQLPLPSLQNLASEDQGRVEVMVMERTNATVTVACLPSGPSPPRMELVGKVIEIIFYSAWGGVRLGHTQKLTQTRNREQ